MPRRKLGGSTLTLERPELVSRCELMSLQPLLHASRQTLDFLVGPGFNSYLVDFSPAARAAVMVFEACSTRGASSLCSLFSTAGTHTAQLRRCWRYNSHAFSPASAHSPINTIVDPPSFFCSPLQHASEVCPILQHNVNVSHCYLKNLSLTFEAVPVKIPWTMDTNMDTNKQFWLFMDKPWCQWTDSDPVFWHLSCLTPLYSTVEPVDHFEDTACGNFKRSFNYKAVKLLHMTISPIKTNKGSQNLTDYSLMILIRFYIHSPTRTLFISFFLFLETVLARLVSRWAVEEQFRILMVLRPVSSRE